MLAPVGRDGPLICRVLEGTSLSCHLCPDPAAFHKALHEGAGAALLTEEALTSEAVETLEAFLVAQPAPFDLPLILLATRGSGASRRLVMLLGAGRNVTVLERPVPTATLQTVVMSAVKARRRQYEVEELMTRLRMANKTLETRVEERTRELVEANEGLRRSERRFSQTFHAGPVAACLTTLATDRFLEVNASFLALTGYGRDEVVGRSAAELRMWSSPEDQRKLAAQETPHDLELSLQTKGGEVRTVLLSGERISLDDEEVQLKQFYDITERKRSQEELMQAIETVMQDATWFSRQVVERLAQLRTGEVDATGVAELTPRERQVLERLARGMNNRAIAAELGLAEQTVRNYIAQVYEKAGVHSRAEAVVWARERGLVGR